MSSISRYLGRLFKTDDGLKSPEWLKPYQASRSCARKDLICHAPFSSMYFNVHGQVAPCWLNLQNAPCYPAQTLHDIWFSNYFSDIRKHIEAYDLSVHCGVCEKNIRQGNHISTLAKLYDQQAELKTYPTLMEFELSNRCNLECVMCKGELSSTIRKNREQLPALNNPYDAAFVEQLDEFIPHLREAKFLGGEPFLIDIYFDIWERMIALNPSIEITITTNGSVLNEKVKRVLDKLNCHLIISIDAIEKETYEAIRLGGKFERVLENFNYFAAYAHERKKYLGVSVNPLRKNWQQMPGFIEFCNRYNAQIWFNTVIYPHAEALWTLGASELEQIYHELSNAKLVTPRKEPDETNVRHYHNLVQNQIKNWWQAALTKEQKKKAELPLIKEGELGSLIFKQLECYIREDAYLPAHQKENYLKKAANVLKEKNDDTPYLSSLFILPDSLIFEALCMKKVD